MKDTGIEVAAISTGAGYFIGIAPACDKRMDFVQTGNKFDTFEEADAEARRISRTDGHTYINMR